MTRYLLAGGGTAGHVNPLLALAEYIAEHEPESEIYVLGTREGLESRLVPERGFKLLTIERLPFPRRPGLYALRFPKKFGQAVRSVRQMIKDLKIDVVVGFGGYASAPAYRAAKKENIGTVIHEANAKPGLANILGARNADAVAVTFAGTPIRGATVTGMPLRKEIEQLDKKSLTGVAREHFGLDPDLKTLVITGGSLGARAINEAMYAAAQAIRDAGVQVLHIWGGLTQLRDPEIAGYQVIKYCDRMDLAFAASTLMVSRAGSAAVSEIAGLGIPAVFVPYSFGNGEQRKNASAVVNAGGALLVEDEQLTAEWVTHTLLPLINNEQELKKMSRAASAAGNLDGTAKLFELIQSVSKGKKS